MATNESNPENSPTTFSDIKRDIAREREKLSNLKQSYNNKLQLLKTRRSAIETKQGLAATFAFSDKVARVAEKAGREIADLDSEISKLRQDFEQNQKQISAKIRTLEDHLLQNRKKLKQNEKLERQRQRTLNVDERIKNIIAIVALLVFFAVCVIALCIGVSMQETKKAERQAAIAAEEQRDFYINVSSSYETPCNFDDNLACDVFYLNGTIPSYDTVELSSGGTEIEVTNGKFRLPISANDWKINYESDDFTIDNVDDIQETRVNLSLYNTLLEKEVATNECRIRFRLTSSDKNKILEKHRSWKAKVEAEALEKAEQERLAEERRLQAEQEELAKQQSHTDQVHATGTFNDSLVITITSIDRNLAKKDDQELISLNLSLKCISKYLCSFYGFGDYAVLSSSEKSFTAGENVEGKHGTLFNPSISAGETLTGNIYYWVPSDSSLHAFFYNPSYEGNGIRISF